MHVYLVVKYYRGVKPNPYYVQGAFDSKEKAEDYMEMVVGLDKEWLYAIVKKKVNEIRR